TPSRNSWKPSWTGCWPVRGVRAARRARAPRWAPSAGRRAPGRPMSRTCSTPSTGAASTTSWWSWTAGTGRHPISPRRRSPGQGMVGHGLRVVETRVGDRYVLEALEAEGAVLGGEQSGHVVFADLATTGDGLLSGLVLLDVMARSGRPLSELAGVVTKLPQVL